MLATTRPAGVGQGFLRGQDAENAAEAFSEWGAVLDLGCDGHLRGAHRRLPEISRLAYMNIIHDFHDNNSLDRLIRTAYIINQAVG
jgi:hypothetical protein